MSTEDGMVTPSMARKNINMMRRRLAWVEEKAAEKENKGWDHNYELAEIRALKWALPILEAEWDYLVRKDAELDLTYTQSLIATEAGRKKQRERNAAKGD